jgi:RNA polymerase sigma-70 factor (ECF subfamily)
MAVREPLAVARETRRHVAADDDKLTNLVAAGGTPELEYFKRVYQREFADAFREAIRRLSDRERTLLRQHFLDGVSIHQLARMYRVHRVTAGRWLERARASVLDTTRSYMMERLAIPPAELESILRLVMSRIEISLRPLFRMRQP